MRAVWVFSTCNVDVEPDSVEPVASRAAQGLRNHFFVFYDKKLYWAIFSIFKQLNIQYLIPVYPGWNISYNAFQNDHCQFLLCETFWG